MKIRITPARLHGSVAAIPAKSELHRLLICAALADAPTRIIAGGSSQDIEATAACLKALGAKIRQDGEGWLVEPIGAPPLEADLDCAESGSTLRFLLPMAMALCPEVRFSGGGRLPERPIRHLLAAMSQHGVTFSGQRLPFSASGRLLGGDYQLPGNVSSQYISGLLLALPCCEASSTLIVTTPLESAAYLDITLAALRRFGVGLEAEAGRYSLSGAQVFHSPGTVPAGGRLVQRRLFPGSRGLGRAGDSQRPGFGLTPGR